MSKYKLYCVNLKRRNDRRLAMIDKFQKAKINQYSFFDAIDGYNLDKDEPDIKFFKHSNASISRKGIIGCALSHYKLWKKLCNDSDTDYYLIMEDDIDISDNFNIHIENFLNKIKPDTDILLFGMSMEKNNREISRDIYQYDTSYSIHPLNRGWYAGGLFCYLITKNGANKLCTYIKKNGIKLVIDFLTLRAPLTIYETHPHLAFTQSVQHFGQNVDSDIQKEFSKITIDLIDNNWVFDDYLFCPNQDSTGNDIIQMYADISTIKEEADKMDNCVAFNTLGWLKHTLLLDENFSTISNKFHNCDGIYIKKKYLHTCTIKKPNYYLFDDYIFYGNKDSLGHNMMHCEGDILSIKTVADSMSDCVAFNTNGYLKYDLVEEKNFIHLKNNINMPDGIYIKKSHHPDIVAWEKKLEKFRITHNKRMINIFVSEKALLFTKQIVDIILSKFNKYKLVKSSNMYDLTINHITEDNYFFNNDSLNILISDTLKTINHKFDIAIDTKYQTNAMKTIYLNQDLTLDKTQLQLSEEIDIVLNF